MENIQKYVHTRVIAVTVDNPVLERIGVMLRLFLNVGKLQIELIICSCFRVLRVSVLRSVHCA